jgi:hypothetical protein
MSQARFFRGLVEIEIDEKPGLIYCLADCKKTKVTYFKTPTALALAIYDLCLPQLAEPNLSIVHSFEPRKEIPIQDSLEDWGEYFLDANDNESSLDHTFVLGGITHQSVGQEWQVEEEFSDHFSGNKRVDSRVEAVFLRSPEAIEKEDSLFGPFFSLNDFTENVEDIPENLRNQHRFLSHNDVAKAYSMVEKELNSLFHPEQETLARRGQLDPDCLDDALNFEEYSFMKPR